jgi:predicted dehydrogenase/threonine dehydrogenase-like Zn-dependent dehydrogenase
MRRGSLTVVETPCPQLQRSRVLVRTAASVISAGTERAVLEFARASLLDKARSRPDLLEQVVEKVRRDGLLEAGRAALSRLDRPVAPGYAAAGVVEAVSPDVTDIRIGDRVACAGAGYATHAEVNAVPRNLVVPIPKRGSGEWVGFDEAAFSALGAIALHGVRLARPELGDRAVVIGLGVVGLLVVQILRANGCRVLGVDVNAARCGPAQELGADVAVEPRDALAVVQAWSGNFGADLVVVAAATDDSEPATLAAALARDKGRIVAIGATGLDLPRRVFYQKELSVVVSRSYGPGRYDPDYEERGRDYPLAHVRWTERENMRAFLGLVAEGSVKVRPLISHRFPIDDAEQAYGVLQGERVLGIVLEYPEAPRTSGPVHLRAADPGRGDAGSILGVSIIGAGNFAHGVLLPAVARDRSVALRGVVTASGLSARYTGDKFGFAYAATAAAEVWDDSETNAVMIATRHDAHASLVAAALDAGKAVFVEKPLCLTEPELVNLVERFNASSERGGDPFVMVGFNRRFAAATAALRRHFSRTGGPVNVLYRVNAGRVPSTSWVARPDEGGGRVVGEVCHFVDLCAYLAGGAVEEVSAIRSGVDDDDVMVTLRIGGGSIATIAYMTDGDRAAPKERVEVFGGASVGVIDDFRTATISHRGRQTRVGSRFTRQDKGHAAEVAAFLHAVRAGAGSPVPFEAAVSSTRATLAIVRSLESGQPVRLSS